MSSGFTPTPESADMELLVTALLGRVAELPTVRDLLFIHAPPLRFSDDDWRVIQEEQPFDPDRNMQAMIDQRMKWVERSMKALGLEEQP